MFSLLTSGPGLAGIAIALSLAFGGIQTYRLNSCQAAVAVQRAQVAILGSELDEQNRAVEALEEEGARKAKEASQALAKATAKGRVWQDNATRLQAVLTARKPDGPKDCRTAWEEIRK